MKNIDLIKYSEFVYGVTSAASSNIDAFVDSLHRLENGIEGSIAINAPLFLTAAMGMNGEAGEFSEIAKKCAFHGKTLTPEVHEHLQKELGDIIFYWINACKSIGVDPNIIIQSNINKLSSRYPNGFSTERSEKRDVGDI